VSDKLINPFWTSGLVSQVDQFFGRGAELGQFEENIERGGVAICGPVGIGKSSLLSRLSLKAVCVMAMCSSGNEPWQLARKLYNQFRNVTHKKVKQRGFDIYGAIWKDTTEDRELAGDEYITAVYEILYDISKTDQFDYVVVQFDECHSCAPALALLIRELKEQLEHSGVQEIRFITAGIGAYIDRMLEANDGIGRALQNRFNLIPWSEEETIEFVQAKLAEVCRDAMARGIEVTIRGTRDDDLPTILYNLSGGHPFLAQLLGAYLIRHENADRDGSLDPRDLVGGMKEICTRNRLLEYNQMIASLEESGMLSSYQALIGSLESKEPSQISSEKLSDVISEDEAKWFLDNGFMFETVLGGYQLTDELLRVSLLLREDKAVASREEQDVLGSADDDFDDE
jgi:hypothetical protein